VSEGSVRIDGKTIEYTATAGTLEMKDEDGEPIAHFGYTAYVRKGGDLATRPIMFAYNGGPGSASMWLHMGILGPQRTEVMDAQFTTEGPFKRRQQRVLGSRQGRSGDDRPGGHGLFPPGGGGRGAKTSGAWTTTSSPSPTSSHATSPTTAAGSRRSTFSGESYGGIRSGGVAYKLLTAHSIALNGVILVSPYMDFVAGYNRTKNDLAHVNYFTTFASTAWYHQTIAGPPRQP
jgi:carboxypeptidase C (cathepsin A)